MKYSLHNNSEVNAILDTEHEYFYFTARTIHTNNLWQTIKFIVLNNNVYKKG